VIAVFEVFSIFSFNSPIDGGEMWSIRADYDNGDLGFDPLRLRPESADEFKELQTKELNNGRLAMIAMAGMIAQELVTGQRLFSCRGTLHGLCVARKRSPICDRPSTRPAALQ
jgi:hypothetical protein